MFRGGSDLCHFENLTVEGEHRSIEELVQELREVGEEVQVRDSLQREVEQLEEKLADLGGEVREGGARARSLEVKMEAKDVSRKLWFATGDSEEACC